MAALTYVSFWKLFETLKILLLPIFCLPMNKKSYIFTHAIHINVCLIRSKLKLNQSSGTQIQLLLSLDGAPLVTMVTGTRNPYADSVRRECDDISQARKWWHWALYAVSCLQLFWQIHYLSQHFRILQLFRKDISLWKVIINAMTKWACLMSLLSIAGCIFLNQ